MVNERVECGRYDDPVTTTNQRDGTIVFFFTFALSSTPTLHFFRSSFSPTACIPWIYMNYFAT